jgi:hypothetical protein
MNLKHKFSGKMMRCEKCERKLILEREKTSLNQRVWNGFLWSAIPLLLIVLVLLGELDYRIAILTVIGYHFACFIGIIGWMDYSKAKK